jgi:hypothetical protein
MVDPSLPSHERTPRNTAKLPSPRGTPERQLRPRAALENPFCSQLLPRNGVGVRFWLKRDETRRQESRGWWTYNSRMGLDGWNGPGEFGAVVELRRHSRGAGKHHLPSRTHLQWSALQNPSGRRAPSVSGTTEVCHASAQREQRLASGARVSAPDFWVGWRVRGWIRWDGPAVWGFCPIRLDLFLFLFIFLFSSLSFQIQFPIPI